MSVSLTGLDSPAALEQQAIFEKKLSAPWQKLTAEDLANFDTAAGRFNPGYDPYPGKTIWGGWNLPGADPNSYYAGDLDNSYFHPQAQPDSGGGIMGGLARSVAEMAPGLSIMALPFLGGAITSAAGGAAAGEVVGGAAGSESLIGGADALGGGEFLFPGESATSGAAWGGSTMPAAAAEPGFDAMGGYNVDPNTGDVFYGSGDNPFGTNFNGGTNDFFTGAETSAGEVAPGMLESMKQQALSMAKQFGITPAAALGLLKNALTKGAPAVLGAIAANKQADSLGALAKQYMDLGAPSRARYEASFAPGFTMANDAGYQGALDQAAKASMHALSVSGNPAGSPNAWGRSMQDLYEKTAYPALQNFRNTNANAGGIATLQTAAPGAATGAINAQGNVFNAIGAGVNDIFNPQPSLAQTLAEYQRLIKGTVQ